MQPSFKHRAKGQSFATKAKAKAAKVLRLLRLRLYLLNLAKGLVEAHKDTREASAPIASSTSATFTVAVAAR